MYPQGPYQQPPYNQPWNPPPKRGIGVIGTIGIVVVVLVVVVMGLAIIGAVLEAAKTASGGSGALGHRAPHAKVNVECRGAGVSSFSCSVASTGPDPATVCWDAVAVCDGHEHAHPVDSHN